MPIYLTPKGKEKLKKELKELISQRPQIIKRIEKAREFGDLKENAEYHDAKDQQGMVESRIREIEAILVQAEVVSKKESAEKIEIGSKIKVELNGNIKEYEIVGASEASPLEGKISNDSPLAKAFLGHRKGEEVEVNVPAGKLNYKILEIE